jgi:LysM repeat protein
MAVPTPPGYKKPRSYVVRKGDTLESIAKQFGLNDTHLLGANKGVKGMNAGVVLSIPEPPGLTQTNSGGGPGGKPGWTPSTGDWVSQMAVKSSNFIQNASASLVNKVLGTPTYISNWWNMRPDVGWNAQVNPTYRTVGMGEVQRFGYAPEQDIPAIGQFGTGKTRLGMINPETGTELANTKQTTVTGNHQEKLGYGKSYNYEASKGTIPMPGLEASVNYFGDTYEMETATGDGYGYDYGSYLQWASEKGIQQPASYYNWKKTQGVTRSGQSSQFWEYMQEMKAGNGLTERERRAMSKKVKSMRLYRQNRDNPVVVEEEEETGTAAIQPDTSASSYNNSRYYSSPSSFGLVSWRM